MWLGSKATIAGWMCFTQPGQIQLERLLLKICIGPKAKFHVALADSIIPGMFVGILWLLPMEGGLGSWHSGVEMLADNNMTNHF